MADLSHLTDEQLTVYREMLAKKGQPQETSASQPESGMDKMIGNIPGSLYKAVTHPTFPGMPVGQGDATHPATFEDFKEKTLPKVVNAVKHPIDTIKNSFIDDPVGSGLTAAAVGRGAFPNTAGTIEGAVSGGARAASEQVRPLLSKFSPFMHPLKMAPDLYDAGVNVFKGAKQGVQDFRATQNVGKVGTPPVPSNVSKVSDMPVGPTVRPVLPSGRTVPGAAPETLPSKPVTRQGGQGQPPEAAPQIASHPVENGSRKVISDENGKPLSFDDPVNGVNGADLDIHKKIAQEGVEKRAADSRAKYEDVYQNIIKDNYSPEELRSLATNPEAKTYLDLKIKDLKHPEGHPKAGHRKYGSGLNPMMIETLAQRLESEQ